jgi:hypothetical protein
MITFVRLHFLVFPTKAVGRGSINSVAPGVPATTPNGRKQVAVKPTISLNPLSNPSSFAGPQF